MVNTNYGNNRVMSTIERLVILEVNKDDEVEQRFSTCGTRTTSGTRRAHRWYVK
jgi:hypothetical protein